jgi:hypothetical protein
MPPATETIGAAVEPTVTRASATAHVSGAVRNYGVGFWSNAPRIRPPSLARLLHTTQLVRREYWSVLVGTQICDGGNFEKCCEFRENL